MDPGNSKAVADSEALFAAIPVLPFDDGGRRSLRAVFLSSGVLSID